ncbi:MAG: hypothetical protein ABIA74_06165 [bacterium]
MKQFFRYLFFIFTVFSLNFSFLKSETEEEKLINYVVAFFETNKINKLELEQKINLFFMSNRIQKQQFPHQNPSSVSQVSLPDLDDISTPNINFIPQPETGHLSLITRIR